MSWLLVLLAGGCVEPYFPEVMEAPNSYLVVNGFLNGSGPTEIQLLRTQNLHDESKPPAESGAVVRVESERGESFRLNETEPGRYTNGILNLSPTSKYRLFIRTNNGKEYASDYIEVKQTPAIDKVTWEPVNNEVQFYVSTHDDQNNSWYYRWEFEHTWQFRAAHYSNLKYVDGQIIYRDVNNLPNYYCWRTENSTTIELGSSAKLSNDVISNYKLVSVPYNSEKLSIKNSVLVKQYALPREAYEYWQLLKKNTESIGTLFDPLPSQLNSNIRSLSDPQEPVIGYLTASTVQEKRIFVSQNELPREWRLYMPNCELEEMLLGRDNIDEYFKGEYLLPISEIYDDSGMRLLGYTYTARRCADCTLMGTNVRPNFWE